MSEERARERQGKAAGANRPEASGGSGASRRDRIAAQRAAAQRAQRRNRLLIVGGAIIAVVAIVVGFVAFSGNSSPGGSGPAIGTPPTGHALDQLVARTTSVPAAALDRAGAGQASGHPSTVTGAPLTSNGKPEVLYMGADYCPYCAAQRWGLVVALSRFGTFSGLATTHSAARNGGGHAEPFPNTATWTFASTTFTSKYLTFTPVEMNTNIPDPSTGGYTTLQQPTAEQTALLTKYDANGSIPFINFGNKYVSVGASYDPGVLSGLTWNQIADDLHNQGSPVAKSVLGPANYMTAAICSLTGGQPASACTTAVKSLQSSL